MDRYGEKNKFETSNQVSTIHHAAGHVFAVARITLHHHWSWFKDRHGDFCHWELLMIRLLCWDDWRIRGQHEVNAWIRDQICLEPCGDVWKQAVKTYSLPKPVQFQGKLQILFKNPRNSVMSTLSAPSKPVCSTWLVKMRQTGCFPSKNMKTGKQMKITHCFPSCEGTQSNLKWSGRSTCSNWCRLGVQCPSSFGKCHRALRCHTWWWRLCVRATNAHTTPLLQCHKWKNCFM